MPAKERPVALTSPLAELERQARTICRPSGDASVAEFFLGRRFSAGRRLSTATAGDWLRLERDAAPRDA